MREGRTVVQMGPGAPPAAQGVRYIQTPTFRYAAAVLSLARAAVLPEGGLHHAAAVLGIPAVVLFGGYISPESTGYPNHINIAEGEPCGRWVDCAHCRDIWDRLDPAYVASQFDALFQQKAA